MKEKHGEYICIFWDDDSDVEYVKGHVALQEAQKAMDDWGGTGSGEQFTDCRHRWARWVPAPRGSDYTVMLHTLDQPARGAFPVTELLLAGKAFPQLSTEDRK